MQNILVTGGAGFIGSHLCRYLLRQNRRVVCLDNLWTGKENNINSIFSSMNPSEIRKILIANIFHLLFEYFKTYIPD